MMEGQPKDNEKILSNKRDLLDSHFSPLKNRHFGGFSILLQGLQINIKNGVDHHSFHLQSYIHKYIYTHAARLLKKQQFTHLKWDNEGNIQDTPSSLHHLCSIIIF